MDGQLFEVDEADHGARARSPASITARSSACASGKDGSVVLGAGDPGKLYVLQD